MSTEGSNPSRGASKIRGFTQLRKNLLNPAVPGLHARCVARLPSPRDTAAMSNSAALKGSHSGVFFFGGVL